MYAAVHGLCRTHYLEKVHSTHIDCKVDGCDSKAGSRSGLCLPHVRYRGNKRRSNPSWDYPNNRGDA